MSEQPFQQRVQPWMMECFGPAIAADTRERNHRFIEKALELVQACGATRAEAHQLVDNVYDYEDIVDACCEAWNKFTQIPALFDHCARVAGLA